MQRLRAIIALNLTGARGGQRGQGGPRGARGGQGWPGGQGESKKMPKIWGPSLLPNGKRSIAGLGHYSPRIPGGFTLPHRSDGTLGRGPRSEPRAPMQMVSGALGSLGFRV